MPTSMPRSRVARPSAVISVAGVAFSVELGSARAVLCRVSAHAQTLGTFFDDEQRDALRIGVGARGARGHDERIGLVAGRHDALRAVDHPAARGLPRFRRDVVQAISRRALLVREHDERRRVGDLRQPLITYRDIGRREQRRRDQRTVCIRRVDEPAAELFHHDHRIDRAEAHAALRLGHRQAGEAELGELGVDLTRLAAGLRELVAALEAEAFVHPATHRVAQRFLIGCEVEIHDRCPSDWSPLSEGAWGSNPVAPRADRARLSRARSEQRCCVALRSIRRRSSSCAC